jgi:hypothetical protein
MISLACTSCKKILEIDDAFAGGVCRCQHCGTIQTVPAALKRSNRPGAPQPAVSKALYQKHKPRAPGEVGRSGSGLEALADSVGASSGLARSALNNLAATPTDKPPPTKTIAPILLVAAVAVIALLLVVIVWLTTR